MRRFYPYIFLFFSIVFSTFVWEYISIPYNDNNLIKGEFFQKKLNFAFNTSNTVLAASLEKGFNNVQGIDSDIDYILRDR